jgi:hypothetical protein
MLGGKHEVGMGEYDHKIAALREDRTTAIAALMDIKSGAKITQNGVDVTDRRRGHLENLILKLEALIVAYEGLDA